MMDELENRVTELEIRLTLQDELLASLNDTVAKQADLLDLQQAQLRMLYDKWQQGVQESGRKPYSLVDEVPPHY